MDNTPGREATGATHLQFKPQKVYCFQFYSLYFSVYVNRFLSPLEKFKVFVCVKSHSSLPKDRLCLFIYFTETFLKMSTSFLQFPHHFLVYHLFTTQWKCLQADWFPAEWIWQRPKSLPGSEDLTLTSVVNGSYALGKLGVPNIPKANIQSSKS